MAPKQIIRDRNFNGLVSRFQRNIYQTMKGRVRLAILQRDFNDHIPSPLNVLDVGCGEGRWAGELVKLGHSVTLTDISLEMLEASRVYFESQSWWQEGQGRVNWLESALQELPDKVEGQFDLLNCHAVLEWLEKPQSAIHTLASLVRPNGYLSLLFYNLDGLIYKNLLRGNYKKIQRNDFNGARGSLTPINPIRIQDVLQWLDDVGFNVLCQSGVRVFHDYILDPVVRRENEDDAVAMELQFSQQVPFRDLGRYVHILAEKRI